MFRCTIFVPQPKVPGRKTPQKIRKQTTWTLPHHDGEIVDLAPIMREYIIPALPPRILCKDDCLGL